MIPFDRIVTTEQELREIVGIPGERALLKQRSGLDEHFRAFIALSPFLLMATSDHTGRCDVSPKGDTPGFVHVLDDDRLVVPDRWGNKRLDGMRNMLANPHAGLIFFVPGREETLRVNGRAWITRDPTLLEPLTLYGKTPRLAIGVQVEEAFFHCVKSFRRSKLWVPDKWPKADALPPYACALFDQIKPKDVTLEGFAEGVKESDANLYV